MKKPFIHFIISAVLGLGLGYLVFDVIAADNSQEKEVALQENQDTEPAEVKKEETDKSATAEPTAADGNILQTKGCLACHSVSGLNLSGGATGPDLTQAFNNVEGKHGKPIEEFLKEPTSAVMSGVIGGSPLTDEEISQIVETLKQASEAK